ncbi:hypothetical protein [Streptacidiphilus sp. PAMC 29251]
MRVKLRPDAHCAPVSRGVYWVRGERSFVLSGPPALYSLVDDQLDALLDGTSVDAMVAAVGDEAARPVVEHVVRALVAQDVLIDLDAVQGPLPDQQAVRDHLELLAYLETHCAEPYRAFAAVRSARVAVAGRGPAAESGRRGLTAHGIGEVTDPHVPYGAAESAPPTLVLLVDDCEDRLDLLAAAAALPPGTPVLPVAAEAGFALVGPVCGSPQELRSFQALRARVADWQRSGSESPAVRPISAVLAGSLAAQAVLARLAGTDEAPARALVVYGHAAQTRPVPLPDAGGRPVWRQVDADEALTAPPEAAPAAADTSATDADPADEAADPQQVHRLAAPLTARWTGLARWGRDLDLPQLPVSLVTAEQVARPVGAAPGPAAGPAFLGWGGNRAVAGLTAVLAVLRRSVAEQPAPDGGDGLPAAGLTLAHWLADGLLRGVGQELLTHSTGDPLSWETLDNHAVRSAWSLLGDFFGAPAVLRLHTVPGLDWRLVQAVHEESGEVLAAEWGPSPMSAGYAALFAATARAQFRAAEETAPQAPVLPVDPVGTWSLEVAPERQIRACLRQLLDHTGDRGLRLRARQLVRDEALGELPLTCGWVALG